MIKRLNLYEVCSVLGGDEDPISRIRQTRYSTTWIRVQPGWCGLNVPRARLQPEFQQLARLVGLRHLHLRIGRLSTRYSEEGSRHDVLKALCDALGALTSLETLLVLGLDVQSLIRLFQIGGSDTWPGKCLL